jgi:hypothetical protein
VIPGASAVAPGAARGYHAPVPEPDPHTSLVHTRRLWLTRRRSMRIATVCAGVVLIQAILYGPSLVGSKILLPLEILALPGVYLPATPATAALGFDQHIYSDQILAYEMNRRFATAELRDGRIPMWNPHGYAGAPFATFFKFSPFVWPYYLTGSPRSLAWSQLLIALVASLGAYAFFRITLRLPFWPSALIAWCLPLTGFFLLWQGYSLPQAAAWLPWLLLAVDQTARRNAIAGPMLAMLTALVLISGQVDVAAQALIASVIFGAWSCVHAHRGAGPSSTPAQARVGSMGDVGILASAGALVSAMSIGALLAAPYLLPLQEYVRTGHRVAERAAGMEERPPVGVSALPQLLLPDAYGGSGAETLYIGEVNHLESAAAAYTGLLLTLLVAPHAWRSRRHRTVSFVLLALLALGLSWQLALPGFVQLLRLPGLNVLSHNRFVFVSSFSILALSAIGLSAMRGTSRLSKWTLASGLVGPVLFGIWCVWHVLHPPEPIASALETAWRSGETGLPVRDLAHIHSIQRSFRETYLQGAILCLIALTGWILLARTQSDRRGAPWSRRSGLVFVIALVSFSELLIRAHGTNPQTDPALYYPPIPVLERLSEIAHDRVLGVGCLPPNLGERFGFEDVRGYDGVDPARIVELLDLAVDPQADPSRKTAQWFTPRMHVQGGDVWIHPVLSMLNVRYLIFRGQPPPSIRALLSGEDYWIAENRGVLPRTFIPRRVERVSDGDETLARLASPEFQPAEVAFIDEETSVFPAEMSGEVRIVEETSTRIDIACSLPAPALVVLADRWDPGWKATVNGRDTPILRVNHAIRGVAARAGTSAVRFTYRPDSFRWGLWTAAFAVAVWVFWMGQVLRSARRSVRSPRRAEGTHGAESLHS